MGKDSAEGYIQWVRVVGSIPRGRFHSKGRDARFFNFLVWLEKSLKP